MSKNYLRKCPFCSRFFFSRKDLRAHVKALHDRDIDDVPPYSLIEEAARRTHAKFIYEYKPASAPKCELCGATGQTYIAATEDGGRLIRCRKCLAETMATMKAVRFIPRGENEHVKGWEIIETGQTTLR